MRTRRSGRVGTAAMAAGLVPALVLGLSACGGGETYTLNGAVVLRSADDIAVDGGGEICAGREGSGYEDILGGEDVVVANVEGEVVAQTTLGPGEPADDGTECTFPWQAAELPEADGYFIQVADREPVPYSLDELRDSDFEIVLALED